MIFLCILRSSTASHNHRQEELPGRPKACGSRGETNKFYQYAPVDSYWATCRSRAARADFSFSIRSFCNSAFRASAYSTITSGFSSVFSDFRITTAHSFLNYIWQILLKIWDSSDNLQLLLYSLPVGFCRYLFDNHDRKCVVVKQMTKRVCIVFDFKQGVTCGFCGFERASMRGCCEKTSCAYETGLFEWFRP